LKKAKSATTAEKAKDGETKKVSHDAASKD
jgi:hypothetical protein